MWETDFSDIDNAGNVAVVYGSKGSLALQDPDVCAQMQQLHKERQSTIWAISGQYQISSSSCISHLTSKMRGWLLWCIVPQWWGGSGKLSKNIFWKTVWLVSWRPSNLFQHSCSGLIFCHSIDFIWIHGKGLRLLCLERVAALEGQGHRQPFHRETTKIQGCSV